MEKVAPGMCLQMALDQHWEPDKRRPVTVGAQAGVEEIEMYRLTDVFPEWSWHTILATNGYY